MSKNARATNDHSHKASLAYAVNVFCSPILKGYFEDMGIEVREDLFALSEMLQWVWRSRIRQDPPQPITLYVPAERMRDLLKT